jgi:hypothetical protein
MKFPPRLFTAAAVLAIAVACPRAVALVSLQDGKDHLFVDGTFEMGYDSNVFTNALDKGSMVYEGSLGVEFTRRAGWIGVNGNVSITYARYSAFRAQNYDDPKFSLEFTKQTGRTTGSITMSVQREDRADVTVNTRDPSWNYDLGVNVQYPVIERYTISGSFDFNRIDYVDKQLFTDLSTYTGNLYLYYVLNEQRDLFINYRARYEDEANGSYDIDNAVMSGVSGRVYGPFNGSLQVGVQERAPYRSVDTGTFEDITASGSATWNIDRRDQLTASLSRDYSNTAQAQNIEVTQAGLTYQDSINAKSSGSLGANFGENRFLGVEGIIEPLGRRRVDWFYSLSASYYYMINEHLKISLNYIYYRSYSTLAYAEFPRQQINLTLASHW